MAFKIHKEIIMKVGLSTNILKNMIILEKRIFIVGIFIGLLLFMANIFSLSFVLIYFSTNLKSSLFAILQFAGGISALYSLVMFWLNRERIPRIVHHIDKVQGILSHHVVHAQRIGDKLTVFLMLGLVAAFCTIWIMAVCSGLYLHYKNGFIDFARTYRPYTFVVPWNQNDANGYALTMIVSTLMATAYTFCNSMVLSFFCYICLYFRAFMYQFQDKIEQLHGNFFNDDSKPLKIKTEEAKQQFKNAIAFHVHYKSIFADAATLYSGVLFIQSIGGVFYIAISIVQMELALSHLDANVIMIFFYVLNSLFTVFLYTAFGSMVTESFASVSDCVYKAPWNDLPKELKIYTLFMICNSKPLQFYGHKLFSINLGTFQKILKTVSTYYLMFKALLSTQ